MSRSSVSLFNFAERLRRCRRPKSPRMNSLTAGNWSLDTSLLSAGNKKKTKKQEHKERGKATSLSRFWGRLHVSFPNVTETVAALNHFRTETAELAENSVMRDGRKLTPRSKNTLRDTKHVYSRKTNLLHRREISNSSSKIEFLFSAMLI